MSGAGNVSITFRLDSKGLDQLRIIAAEEGISVNLLVSQILANYLEWDRIAARAGMVVLQREVIKALVNHASEELLKNVATKAADNFMDTLLLMTGSNDLPSLILGIRNNFKKSGFIVRSFKEHGGEKIVIHHDMEIKTSEFFKAYLERLFNNAGYPVKIELTNNSIVVKVPR